MGTCPATPSPKSLFLDFVAKLNANGLDSYMIPSKIEGLAFGQDVIINGVTKHTLFVANDNDFLATIADPHKLLGDPSRGTIANPINSTCSPSMTAICRDSRHKRSARCTVCCATTTTGKTGNMVNSRTKQGWTCQDLGPVASDEMFVTGLDLSTHNRRHQPQPNRCTALMPAP